MKKLQKFNIIIAENKKNIDYLSNKYFLPSHNREDIKQIILMVIWKEFDSFDSSLSSFPTFLNSIVSREFSGLIRKSKRMKRDGGNILSLDQVIDADGTTFYQVLPITEPTETKEDYNKLSKLLTDQLSDSEKIIYYLHIRGCKTSRISDETSKTIKQISNALCRIRQKAKQLYQDYQRKIK